MANHRNPTSEQWRRLLLEFQEAFDVNDLQVLVRSSFDGLRLEVFARIDTVGNCIQDLFEWANKMGTWVALLAGARGMRPQKRPFMILCDEVIGSLKSDTPPEVQPVPERSILLSRRLPFVDRKPIRAALLDMAEDDGWCGLVVAGPKQVGKTYCQQFVTYLRSKKWADDRLAQVILERERDYAMTPADLARRLVLAVRRRDEPLPGRLPNQKEDRWASDLAVWVAGQVEQAGERTWLVLDGFDSPDVPPATHSFIATLAEEAANRPNLRLVLLGYSPVLPDHIERNLRREPLTYLTADDLRDFFDELEGLRPFRAHPDYQRAGRPADRFIELYDALGGNTDAKVKALKDALPRIVSDLLLFPQPAGGAP